MVDSDEFEKVFSQRIEMHISSGDLAKAFSCVCAFAETSKEKIRLKIATYTQINPTAMIPSNNYEYINVDPEILKRLLNSLIQRKNVISALASEFEIFPSN